MQRKTMVTGISGQLGQAAVRGLLSLKSADVVGGTRTPERQQTLAEEGVDVRFVDFDQPLSLSEALGDIGDLLLVSSGMDSLGERRVQGHLAAVGAAASAGVRHIVYTSLLNADLPLLGRVAADHLATEQGLAASGLRHTSLRNAFYMEMLLDSLPAAIAGGVLATSAGEGAIAYVTRADCAAAAVAAVLAGPGADAVLDVAGAPLTAAELVELANRTLGVSIGLEQLDRNTHGERLVADGVPAPMAAMLAHIDDAVRQGAMQGSSRDFERLTGRPPIAVQQFLETNADAILRRARALGRG